MSKKILVLTGSARKGGNSNRMAQAFAEAAAAKGNEVKVIDTTKLKLNFCHACQTCYKTGTTISTPSPTISSLRTRSCSPVRFTGIPFRRRSRL